MGNKFALTLVALVMVLTVAFSMTVAATGEDDGDVSSVDSESSSSDTVESGSSSDTSTDVSSDASDTASGDSSGDSSSNPGDSSEVTSGDSSDVSSDTESTESSTTSSDETSNVSSSTSSGTSSQNTTSRKPVLSGDAIGGSTFIDEFASNPSNSGSSGSSSGDGNSSFGEVIDTEYNEDDDDDMDYYDGDRVSGFADREKALLAIPITVSVLCIAGLIYFNVKFRTSKQGHTSGAKRTKRSRTTTAARRKRR